MRLLEFEAKEMLAQHKIVVPKSQLLSGHEKIDLKFPLVLKVQIPLGGRGNAGGVLVAHDEAQAGEMSAGLLANSFRGYRARRVLAEEQADISAEYYLALTYDTVAKLPLAIFTAEGGVDIEDLAARDPEKVCKRHFSAREGLMQHQARELIAQAGIHGRPLLALGSVLAKLADIFLRYDCTILEINPLVVCNDGKAMALDCHADIEDDALFRHPEIAALENEKGRFESEKKTTAFEARAAEIDSADHRGVAGRVIEFPGNLGLIIGGGGASLTAFDAVKQHGGEPANYCEIGGNPSVSKVRHLTSHILSKPGVENVSVIMNVVSNTRVDLIARGIIAGVLDAGKDPAKAIAVFRVPGAWEEEGFKILKKYGVPYVDRTVSIDQAAKFAVERTQR